jgi:hypothetical protein
MAKAKQFTIEVENRPGAAAHITKALGAGKVNILALLGTAHGDRGTVQVVVDNAKKAKKVLAEAGYTAAETAVEQVQLSNTPGALAKHLEKLAAKGVNLNSIYATASKGSRKATIVLSH